MQRIQSVEPAKAKGRTKELLETVEKAFGTTPNVAKVMANSPAVLDSFLSISTAMGVRRSVASCIIRSSWRQVKPTPVITAIRSSHTWATKVEFRLQR